MTESEELPESVLAAYERAARTGFRLACGAGVGRLLAALAAAVPGGGRVLEIGTGVGAGLAWLVHGLGPREPRAGRGPGVLYERSLRELGWVIEVKPLAGPFFPGLGGRAG